MKALVPKMTQYGIFRLFETKNSSESFRTSCRIIFYKFWSLFEPSKAKNDDLMIYFEFFRYVPQFWPILNQIESIIINAQLSKQVVLTLKSLKSFVQSMLRFPAFSEASFINFFKNDLC